MSLERIKADPRVALAAWTTTSASRGPKVKHHVALLIHEDGTTAMDCSCESFVLGGRECPHILEARRLWAAERRGA